MQVLTPLLAPVHPVLLAARWGVDTEGFGAFGIAQVKGCTWPNDKKTLVRPEPPPSTLRGK